MISALAQFSVYNFHDLLIPIPCVQNLNTLLKRVTRVAGEGTANFKRNETVKNDSTYKNT